MSVSASQNWWQDMTLNYDRTFLEMCEKSGVVKGYTPFVSKRLNRFKNVNGWRYQLHATRGWKCIGRIEK